MKTSEGFYKADSRNLPKVKMIMFLEHMSDSENFNKAEIRGAKVLLSSREDYVDKCIGYVEVKREDRLCYVQGKVTPEHRVRTKLYTVSVVINEAEEKIVTLKCNDCIASEGGCKHSICFIMWLVKRSEEPSVTSVSCYWKQPRLTEAVTKEKFVLAKEMCKKRTYSSPITRPTDFSSFLEECKKRKIDDSLITCYTNEKTALDKYSVYNLVLDLQSNMQVNLNNLKLYAEELLTAEVVKEIETQTRGQADSKLWHTLRQGRITASKIHEVSKCKTDGVLVQIILGGYKVPETKAIKRGKRLESKVIKEIEAELAVPVQKCGFILISPFIGASPDGLCDDFCVEIKCPMSNTSMERYVKDYTVCQKFIAQTQLQMHTTGKKKALFCVADPLFESNKIYTKYWLYYDRLYVRKLISEAEAFWEKFVLPKIIDSASI